MDRHQVWVKVPGPDGVWRPVSRPFNEEREAQDWALDLSDWFRQRLQIRRVE